MYAERLICPVTTLGPGRRAALWTSGCARRCPGCANPELWNRSERQLFTERELAKQLLDINRRFGVHRLTLTGGDPAEQADAVATLLEMIRPVYDDVLMYTGFAIEELPAHVGEELWMRLAALVDVLIDGPYIEEQNVPEAVLRGSSNQRINYLNEGLKPVYERYVAQGRQVQNFVCGGDVVSVGIHNRPTPVGSAHV